MINDILELLYTALGIIIFGAIGLFVAAAICTAAVIAMLIAVLLIVYSAFRRWVREVFPILKRKSKYLHG